MAVTGLDELRSNWRKEGVPQDWIDRWVADMQDVARDEAQLQMWIDRELVLQKERMEKQKAWEEARGIDL